MSKKRRKDYIEKKNWFFLSIEDIFEIQKTSPEGLTDDEVKKRIELYGVNSLPTKKNATVFETFLRQFLSPLIYILIAAGLVALVLQEITDSVFIFGVILLNAGLGTFQEWRAEKNANELNKLLRMVVKVKRQGREYEMMSEELVPGDIVFLESGQKVPADIRLFYTNNLTVDESFLTGESESIGKKSEKVENKSASIHEQKNMLFAGSTVMTGRGNGIVVETGMNTAVGEIADSLILEEGSKPPLIIRMEKFSKKISYFVLGAIIILALVAISKGMPYREVFFLSVALAVSAIPEGLPIAMTVALSVATKRMAQRNVIVRKLAAVESLGSCTMIASDKTGTLTVNKQTLKKIILPYGTQLYITGEGYIPEGMIQDEDQLSVDDRDKEIVSMLGEVSSVCNEGSLRYENGELKYQGDAIDVAFLTFAYKVDSFFKDIKNKIKITGEIAFESERQYAATRYIIDDTEKLVVKGATEKIIGFCDNTLSKNGKTQLDKDFIEGQVLKLTSNGYRVLALAAKTYGRPVNNELEEKDIYGLTFLGLVGFIDPLRAESKEAVQKAQEAGIQVTMITGDHPLTALAISKELGIAKSDADVMTGAQIVSLEEELDSDKFHEKLSKIHVFARVTPLQKLKIIESMLNLGHFVAVTGDGVNDAPALKKANIGIAMGSGSDIAKDTASIIIVDDNFSSIIKGVEEGRFAYSNVRKVIYLLIATGTAEIILFILSLIAGLPMPLLAVQLLWLNLVTNGIQDVALGFEGGEPGEMKKPPRDPKEGIFNKWMIDQTVISGLTIGLMAFITWYYLINTGMEPQKARNLVLLLMVFLENVHVFNCRSEITSAFKTPISRNYILIGGVVLAQVIHIISMQIPFMQKTLGVEPISLSQWFVFFVASLFLLIIMEVFKKIRRAYSKQ